MVRPSDPIGKALLLVAKRDPSMGRLERFFLDRLGYQVEFVDDGVRGLERARTLLPQIVVTELLLPRLDGLQICRALKAAPETRAIAVLMVSVLAAEDRAREAGADGFLRRPLDEPRLLDTVARLLRDVERGAP